MELACTVKSEETIVPVIQGTLIVHNLRNRHLRKQDVLQSLLIHRLHNTIKEHQLPTSLHSGLEMLLYIRDIQLYAQIMVVHRLWMRADPRVVYQQEIQAGCFNRDKTRGQLVVINHDIFMKKFIVSCVSLLVIFGAIIIIVIKQDVKQDSPVTEEVTYTFTVDQAVDDPSQKTLSDRIKERYEKFIVDELTADKWTKFSDAGNQIPLDQFLSAMNSNIDANLMNLLDKNSWEFYTCTDTVEKQGTRDIVLMMPIALQENYPGDLYTDEIKFLTKWEATFVRDMAKIIFPTSVYDSDPVQFGGYTTMGKQPIHIRKTGVKFADGSEQIMAYLLISDYLLVGSDIKCLTRVQEDVLSTSS